MDGIPAWAKESAQKAFDAGGLTSIVNKDAYDDVLATFARALVAERERAATIAQNKITRAEKAYLGMCDCGNCDLQMVEDFLAAAIRKGE